MTDEPTPVFWTVQVVFQETRSDDAQLFTAMSELIKWFESRPNFDRATVERCARHLARQYR